MAVIVNGAIRHRVTHAAIHQLLNSAREPLRGLLMLLYHTCYSLERLLI